MYITSIAANRLTMWIFHKPWYLLYFDLLQLLVNFRRFFHRQQTQLRKVVTAFGLPKKTIHPWINQTVNEFTFRPEILEIPFNEEKRRERRKKNLLWNFYLEEVFAPVLCEKNHSAFLGKNKRRKIKCKLNRIPNYESLIRFFWCNLSYFGVVRTSICTIVQSTYYERSSQSLKDHGPTREIRIIFYPRIGWPE